MHPAPTRSPEPPSSASYATAAAGAALLVLVVMAGWPDGELESQTNWFVGAAMHDGSGSAGGQSNALAIHGLARDLTFTPPARFVEFPNGTATLTGLARRAADPSVAFAVRVTFSGKVVPSGPTHPPVGSPKLELVPSAYVGQSGPVDPATWRYYTEFEGTLEGRNAMAGAILAVTRSGPAFQIGVGASGKNTRLGASGSIDVTTVAPPDASALPPSLAGEFSFDLSDRCSLSATDGAPAALFPVLAGHALSLPGISQGLVFSAPGRVLERADGTVSLTGIVAHEKNPKKGFYVDIEFSGRVDPGHPQHPPTDDPTLELAPDAYVWNGGSVDPATWTYFTTISGKLTGFGAWKGAKVGLERRGPPVQLGYGANGTNTGYGIGTWVTAKVSKKPAGVGWPKKVDGDLDADLRDDRSTCAGDPSPTKLAKDPMHVSMILPGFAEDLVQLVPARLVERPDGSARFEAILARIADSNRVFFLELELGERIDPGDAGHPPDGSPWTGLKKKAHQKKSGPAHPSFWSYFGALEGRLSGLGAWQGISIKLIHHGDSPQVGFGASGESKGFGAAVPFAWIQSQPGGEPAGSFAALGELRFRLDEDCDAVGVTLPVAFGPDCAPPSGVAPELALLGAPGVSPVRLEVRNGAPNGDLLLHIGTGRGATPLPSGCLLSVDSVFLVMGPFPLDPSGTFAIDVPRAGYMAPGTLALQGFVQAGDTFAATRGVEFTVP